VFVPEPDVLVVGAGPVGLMLSAELALAGADVQVIERRTEPDEAPRAQTINLPTAAALDRRGLLAAAQQAQREALDRGGSPLGTRTAADHRFTGHFAGISIDPERVDWTDPDLAAHTTVGDARLVPQPAFEALLAAHAARLGVEVRRGVTLTDLEQDGDGVVVGTTAGELRARWLVGCDGGHSVVRRLAGFDFPGTDPEFTGYQAVADIAAGCRRAGVPAQGWTWSAHGAYRYGPQPGRIATVEFGTAPADRSAAVTLEEVQASLRRVSGTDVTLTALRGKATRWTDNARQAATYRSGRVLLAGDAAHVHPPFGGQGLNLGVGDAVNLGWKLAAVLAGWAPEDLLDTYDTERRPEGARVLDWTRAQTAMLRGDAKSAALRHIVADLMCTRDGATYAVKTIAGVAARTALPGHHPLIGRVLPDLWLRDGSRLAEHGHGGGFLLLDRTGYHAFTALAAGWAGRMHAVADGPATPLGVLVRPDGVVAWATDTDTDTDRTALGDTLHRWAGAPAS
jgi:2-polyprenyl-6-methoxyphenol hydroxylase-like FAD-dependent oxidoreductase